MNHNGSFHSTCICFIKLMVKDSIVVDASLAAQLFLLEPPDPSALSGTEA